jgi:hypothetical protein
LRRSFLIALLVLALAAGLAACGGGGDGSAGTTGAQAGGEGAEGAGKAEDPATVAWEKEVTAVMSYFENHVSAQMQPTIQDTYNKVLLEPLYRTYSGDLETLAKKLDATKPSPACAAVHKRIGATAHEVAKLTRELSEQSHHGEKWYSLFLERQGPKIQASSRELTELTFEPGC